MKTFNLATHSLAVAILLVAVGTAHAADITWKQVVVDSTDGDSSAGTGLGDAAVLLNGTLIDAANFGSAADVTVNTVLFDGIGILDADTPFYNNQLDGSTTTTGTSTGGGNIDTLTTTFANNGTGNDGTLTGLTNGTEYVVQFIASFAGLNRTATYDDGNGNTIGASTNNPHSFATGFFKADASTQTVNVNASTGSEFLSGYQLRELASGLRVDFNDNDGGVSPTQVTFFSVTQAGATGLDSTVGTIDVALSAFSTPDPDRDRGAVTGTPLDSDLGRDFVFSQAGMLDITLSGVEAGTYEFTAFLHDNDADQGTADIDYSVDGGATFFDGAIGDYTVGAATTELGSASFFITANGIDDIVIRLAGSGNNSLINGFTLNGVAAIPTPAALPAGLALIGLAAMRRRR